MESKIKKEIVFADTAFWKGLVDDKDDFHEKAMKMMEEIRNKKIKLVMTNYVLDETVTLVRVRRGVSKVQELIQVWNSDFGPSVERVTVKDEKRAWNWFWKDWSKLSYTDCTSFAVMERLEIKKVATFDEHFEAAGFEII